jgi:endogenous inhibitor of DNA gyrase (YacG/DUF329 family)
VSAIKEIPCPNCRKLVVWSEASPFRPFCSKRCQMVDFGDWASERHRIPIEEFDLFSEDAEKDEVVPPDADRH